MSTHDHAGSGCCSAGGKPSLAATTARDPVCGMTVDPSTAKGGSATHAGLAYHFCSNGCREKFVANPQHYLDQVSAQQTAPTAPSMHEAAAPAGAIYTCPMHPEIRQQGPGTCPICGMALEPETVTAEAPVNHELIDFTRRLWIGAVLTLPVFALEMGGHRRCRCGGGEHPRSPLPGGCRFPRARSGEDGGLPAGRFFRQVVVAESQPLPPLAGRTT